MAAYTTFGVLVLLSWGWWPPRFKNANLRNA
jgi:hypothetical protein